MSIGGIAQTRPAKSIRASLLVAATVLNAGCTEGVWKRQPRAEIVDDIERKLAAIPCISPLSRWERHYSFKSRPTALAEIITLTENGRWFDYETVKISYRQANFEEFREGRVIHKGHERIGIDDRNYDVVFGDYDVRSGTAEIWACGPNMSSEPFKPLSIVVK